MAYIQKMIDTFERHGARKITKEQTVSNLRGKLFWGYTLPISIYRKLVSEHRNSETLWRII